MVTTTTRSAPASAIVASASAIESAPPEQATPYGPGPSRPSHRLPAARTVLTAARSMVVPPYKMPDRDVPPSGPLARIRAQLAGPRGYRRMDALLSTEDAASAVAALSPNEVYELVHEV